MKAKIAAASLALVLVGSWSEAGLLGRVYQTPAKYERIDWGSEWAKIFRTVPPHGGFYKRAGKYERVGWGSEWPKIFRTVDHGARYRRPGKYERVDWGSEWGKIFRSTSRH